jgi:hypothetical protein
MLLKLVSTEKEKQKNCVKERKRKILMVKISNVYLF